MKRENVVGRPMRAPALAVVGLVSGMAIAADESPVATPYIERGDCWSYHAENVDNHGPIKDYEECVTYVDRAKDVILAVVKVKEDEREIEWKSSDGKTSQVAPPFLESGAPEDLGGLGRRLLDAYRYGILVCMKIFDRTTLNIDRAALAKAAALTGITEKTTLVRMGLEALIASASARRLAALGGTERRARTVRRRRPV